MPTNSEDPDVWQEAIAAINPLLELFIKVGVYHQKLLTISFLAKFTGKSENLQAGATYRLEVSIHPPGRKLFVIVTRNGWHKVSTMYSSPRTLLQNWKIV